MNFGNLINSGIQFFHTHNYIAIVCFVALGFLTYFKFKAMLKLVAIALVFGVVFYVLSLFGKATHTGISQKDKTVNKSIHSKY